MIKNILKYCIRKTQFIFTDMRYSKSVKLFWFKGKHNFGDAINPLLVEKISGKNVAWVDPLYYSKENYLAIGSILERASSQTIVWGSGFISSSGYCKETPKKVCAVRGPLTRNLLLEKGIDCPEIYGDPALLLPTIYNPITEKKYELGIIPHYVDKDNDWLEKVRHLKHIKILDIQTENPYNFIDEILKCDKVVSSSLHGIIVADAYGIPATWVEFSDKVTGDRFKFLDYFASVNRKDKKPLTIDENIELKHIYSHFYKYEISIDLDALMQAFPIKSV